MGFAQKSTRHRLDSSELCCRQTVTASRHSSTRLGRVQRTDVAPCYQKPPKLPTPPYSPPRIDIYGTPANSCNQMLPRDGTERHARLLYQLMIPSRTTGPQGDDLEPLPISGKQIPGGPRLAIWSGKQPGEDGTRRRSICCSLLPLQLAHHQSCRNVLHREVPRSRHRLGSQGWAAFVPTTKRTMFCCEMGHLAGTLGRSPAPMNQRPTGLSTPSKGGACPTLLGVLHCRGHVPDLRGQATSLVASTSNGLPMWSRVHCQQLHVCLPVDG